MSKTDWTSFISPTEETFVFKAALWCESDGRAIRKEIERSGKSPEDQKHADSDDWPAGPYPDGGGEADSPQHCDAGETCLEAIKLPYGGKIGAWLGNDLTEEGVDATLEMVRDDLNRADEHARQVGRLWRRLYDNSFDDRQRDELVELEGPLRAGTPAQVLSQFVEGTEGGVVQKVFFDLDHIYAIGGVAKSRRHQLGLPGTDVPEKAVFRDVAIWMVSATPDGNFTDPEKAMRPAEVFEDRPIEEVLAEIIEEEDWA